VCIVASALAIDQTPTLQSVEPAYNCGTRNAHIRGNLGNRKWLTVDVTNRNA
jgi:hypothetical protein